MYRVGMDDTAGTSTSVELYAARGEYEPFQIIVRSSNGNLTNVRVAVSALHNDSNAVIDLTNIQLYREHYVYVAEASTNAVGSNRSLGVGWYPDALVPVLDPITSAPPQGGQFKAMPFDLLANTNQPFWIDLFVPYGTPAGIYKGTFTVTSDQGQNSGTVQLIVWDFELPRRPSLQSSFGVWDEATGQATAQELLRHKIMPRDVLVSIPPSIADKVTLTSANVGFWSGANVDTCMMSVPPSVTTLRQSINRFSSYKNIILYNYTADEIDKCTDLFDDLKRWSQNIHRAELKNLVVMAPNPLLYDDGLGQGQSVVDIWVILPKLYDENALYIKEVIQKGDNVWSYNSLVQDDYSPKWQIDFAPINFRIQPGFINQSLYLSGLLYWRVDLWTDNAWNDVRTFNNGQRWFYGDGMLVYPGAPVGMKSSIGSMRLKWIREGIEDYEYIELLKQRGYEDEALALSRQVATDWHNWTRDPELLEKVRKELAKRIVETNAISLHLPKVEKK